MTVNLILHTGHLLNHDQAKILKQRSLKRKIILRRDWNGKVRVLIFARGLAEITEGSVGCLRSRTSESEVQGLQ